MDTLATRLTTSDGISIAYRVIGDDPTRPPVVLQHGFAASAARNWEAPGLVNALLDDGRRVILVDARGHGESDKPHDPAHYGEPRMARDLMELFDALGLSEVDLVGYSMGAIISLLTAAQDTRIRRLVIGGVGAGVIELGGVDTRVMNDRNLAAALRADDPDTITDPVARGFRAFAEASGNDRFALAAHAERVHREPILVDAITAAVTVIAGTEDALAARPEVLADALQAHLIRVPGDHLGAVRTNEFRDALLTALR
ncbi:alpha/beta hydrolase [Gordonia sp. CPCC 205515]|uniref:alpha/beta fold hydrolase n=1 Tax=Gordonia sp. CPCC 205515 TaxID=3140791 RepID=UPI003AF3A01B